MTSDGIEGFLGDESYVQLWSVSEILELNQGYSPQDRIPGLTLIGSNGSDTAYGILSTDEGASYVSVPYMELEADCVTAIANKFDDFLDGIAALP